MLIMHNFFLPLHEIMVAMIMEMVKVLLKHKDPDIKVRNMTKIRNRYNQAPHLSGEKYAASLGKADCFKYLR